MNLRDLTERIKSKGYWRVVICPTSFERLRIPTFSKLQELAQACNVHWRGWDYPHLETHVVQNKQDWIESSVDWEYFIEYWRLYRSGQFIHLFALHEEHMDIKKSLPIRYPPRPKRAGYVDFVSVTYTITEIFEFATRMANKDILRPAAFISIGLYNMENHQLATFGGRFLPDNYAYTTNDPIVIEKEIPQQELISRPDEFALDFIVEIFERFNWNNPLRQALSEDQKCLRERRL